MALFGFFSSKKEKSPQKEVNTIIIQEQTSGTSGTEVFGGSYSEEYLYNLRGVDRAKEYEKLREDYQAAMLLGAVKNPILGASREVHAASDDSDHQKHAALVKQVLFNDIDLDQLLYESLNCCDFGYSLFEESYRATMSPLEDDDGKVIMSNYMTMNQPEWRDPKTIYYWNFNPLTRKLMSVTQQANGDLGENVDMDAQFLNIITIKKEGQNYEGRSMLRPCYGPWLRKNTYTKLNAINIEKSQPIPTAQVPTGKENTPEFGALKNALQRFTTHQCNYLIYPQGWDVKLNAGSAYDPSKMEVSIDNEDKRMTMAFAANFLLLGSSGGGGSYSLSNDLSDFFLSSLIYVSKLIEKSINQYIQTLVIINFGKQAKYPKFCLAGIDDKAGKEFSEMVKAFVDSKVIIPDDALEESVRKRTGLPPASEEGRRLPEPPKEKDKSLSEKIRKAIRERNK